jgi:hypothetical protein
MGIDPKYGCRHKTIPMKHPIIALVSFSIIGLTSGCVTGRRSLGIEVPPAESSTAVASKGALSIGQVTDSREFVNKPDSPSTPSINGDVKLLSAEAKSTFIGRQRNTWGHAEGDIVLPDGQNVQGKVSELLREGLKRRGYSVTGGAPISVSAEVQQFWTWMTPGFFALSFEAQLECKVTVTNGAKQSTFVVKGYGLNHGQFAKDSNWREAYDIAVQDFLKNLDAGLSTIGM